MAFLSGLQQALNEGRTQDIIDYINSHKTDEHTFIIVWRNENGDTAAHVAARLKNLPLLKFFLAKYSDDLHFVRNNAGKTILDIAVDNKFQQGIDYITERVFFEGSSRNPTDDDITVLHCVAERDDEKYVECLIKLNKPTLLLSITKIKKLSALHIATENSFHNIVRILLEAALPLTIRLGVEYINLINTRGKRALDYAVDKKDNALVILLLSYNADYWSAESSATTQLYCLEHRPVLPTNYLMTFLELCSQHYLTLSANKAESKKFLDKMTRHLVGIDCCNVDQLTTLYALLISENKSLCITSEGACKKTEQDGWFPDLYLTVHIRFLIELIVTAKARTGVHPLTANNVSLEKLFTELQIALETAKDYLDFKIVEEHEKDQKFFVAHANNTTTKVSNIPTGQFYCSNGGFASGEEDGHAIYINYEGKEIKVFPTVSNLGFGYNHRHQIKKLNADQTLVTTYADTPLKRNERATINGYVTNILKVMLVKADGKAEEKAIDQVYDYPNFEPDQVPTSDMAEIEQKTGNCVVKNYMAGFRYRLREIEFYRQFYLSELVFALENYYFYEKKADQIPQLNDVLTEVISTEAAFMKMTVDTLKVQYRNILAPIAEYNRLAEIKHKHAQEKQPLPPSAKYPPQQKHIGSNSNDSSSWSPTLTDQFARNTIASPPRRPYNTLTDSDEDEFGLRSPFSPPQPHRKPY